MHTDARTSGILVIVRTLLLVQAGIALLGALESLAWSAFFGPSAGVPALLGVATAIGLLTLRSRVPRARATRVLVVVEAAVVAGFLLDLVLALVLVGTVPPLVAWLTRLALPVATIGLARSARRATTPAVSRPGDPGAGEHMGAPDGTVGVAA